MNSINKQTLKLRNLSVSFKIDKETFKVVDDVSFHINKGEILGLVGESGSGKSVTALSIMRLIPSPPGKIEGGQILFNGENVLSLPPDKMRKIRGRQISMIFQEPMTALSPLHKIGSQLVETISLHKKINKKEAFEIAEEWLKKVGISDVSQRLYSYPHELSGGMLQRVMIAMALMLSPQLIIADEPTTALDVTIQAQIFDLLLQIKNENSSLLLITHDMGVIWEMCDKMIVMYASRIVEEGPVKEIFASPAHPYTKGLLKSIPMLSKNTERLPVIPGQVPSPSEYPPGCHFVDRCSYAVEKCKTEKPVLKQITDKRKSACFLDFL